MVRSMIRRYKFLVLSVFILTLLTGFVREAFADLTLAPLRVVFGPRDRSAVVSLVNLAPYVNTYRISWKFYKMDEKGGYTTLDSDPNAPLSFEKMVVFSPRQVVINPGQHQLVRLSLRRPPDLPPGEYRGHLTFTRMTPDTTRRKREYGEKEKPKGQNIGLNVQVTLSIPVIVRSGADNDAKVALTDPIFGTDTQGDSTWPVLKLKLSRVSGKFSPYGNIRVYWKAPGAEEEVQVGTMNNVHLYPELQHRLLSIRLNGSQIKGGTLRVRYFGKYESEGTIWDEKIFPVNE